MYKRRNLLVKHETLCSAALFLMPLTSMPLTTVDEPGIILEALFVERGGVGGNAVVDYTVTICLREGESGQVKMWELMQDRR